MTPDHPPSAVSARHPKRVMSRGAATPRGAVVAAALMPAGSASAPRAELRHAAQRHADELAQALLRAEAAHSEYEKQLGRPVPAWPAWYAHYFEQEQTGAASA